MTLTEKAEAALFLLLVRCVAGCSAMPPPPPARLLCYFQADQRAQARVVAECPPNDAGTRAGCTAEASIMAQLQKEQEACK